MYIPIKSKERIVGERVVEKKGDEAIVLNLMMKRRKTLGLRRSNGKIEKSKGKEEDTVAARHLTVQLGQVSIFTPQQQKSASSTSIVNGFSRFETLLEEESNNLPSVIDVENPDGAEDCILSQDFFCTPDYITPDGQQISVNLDCDKKNMECPKSPDKVTSFGTKRYRHEGILDDSVVSKSPCHEQVTELASDFFGSDELSKSPVVTASGKKQNFVSQSAVALRCRVMPPPCISNPYFKEAGEMDVYRFGYQQSKSLVSKKPCAGNCGFSSTVSNGDGLSRYRTDFHEIEQIGYGHFSRVFKVLKRIDGCMYAVKHSTRQLHQDTERRQALMEVQALAALGSHENIVGYYTSWFENEQLFIQLELCDGSLSIYRSSQSLIEREVLQAMYQIAKALQFIHERGIAHLDVKPDNIYVKNRVYKLGDFGCATRIDKSLPIEEGDARYMPHEILNDNHDNLDKVDIFSLGATMYELVRRSPLTESGSQFLNLREGKIPLLPGYSMQFQNLLKVMLDPEPVKRPSAKELVQNAIFDRFCRTARTI